MRSTQALSLASHPTLFGVQCSHSLDAKCETTVTEIAYLDVKTTQLYKEKSMLEFQDRRKSVAVGSKLLVALLFLCLVMAVPACAKNNETGFLDRTISLQGTDYKYQVFVPEGWTPHKKWPVILFLHGAGERGDDGVMETDVGIGTAIRTNRSAIQAIVVMPQCRKSFWWVLPPMDELAMTALEKATREFHGDTQRTYLTGISMGGFGAWHLAQKYPGRFAALVVICGGIRPPAHALNAIPELAKLVLPDLPKTYSAAAARIGKTPVWIFHGAEDPIVPVTESERMAAAMKQTGAEVHYTEYPSVGHACWDKAFDEPKLFPWLFSKSLGAAAK
jgi:predicted peptidase